MGPPNSTRRPACFAGCVAACSRSNESVGRFEARWSYWTRRYPIVPSFDTNADPTMGVAGPVTWVTSGTLPGWRFASASAMAAWLAGSVIVALRAWNATSAVSPDWAGNRCWSSSRAFSDCAPGILNTSTVVPPEASAATTSTTATSNQTPIVTHLCLAAPWPSRSRKPAMSCPLPPARYFSTGRPSDDATRVRESSHAYFGKARTNVEQFRTIPSGRDGRRRDGRAGRLRGDGGFADRRRKAGACDRRQGVLRDLVGRDHSRRVEGGSYRHRAVRRCQRAAVVRRHARRQVLPRVPERHDAVHRPEGAPGGSHRARRGR